MYVNTLGLFTLPKLFICLGQMSIIVAMTNIVTYFLSYCLNFKLRPQHQSPHCPWVLPTLLLTKSHYNDGSKTGARDQTKF